MSQNLTNVAALDIFSPAYSQGREPIHIKPHRSLCQPAETVVAVVKDIPIGINGNRPTANHLAGCLRLLERPTKPNNMALPNGHTGIPPEFKHHLVPISTRFYINKSSVYTGDLCDLCEGKAN